MMEVWQTSDLDYYVAEELFGWKWYAYVGIPTRSHPDYWERKEMRVRRFFPPLESLDQQWQDYFEKVPHEPANGDEPLAYCYCSSMGPHEVPHFSGHEPAARDMEKEIDRRGLRDKYDEILAAQQGALNEDGTIDHKKMRYVSYENRCIAALAAVGSKYVSQCYQS